METVNIVRSFYSIWWTSQVFDRFLNVYFTQLTHPLMWQDIPLWHGLFRTLEMFQLCSCIVLSRTFVLKIFVIFLKFELNYFGTIWKHLKWSNFFFLRVWKPFNIILNSSIWTDYTDITPVTNMPMSCTCGSMKSKDHNHVCIIQVL